MPRVLASVFAALVVIASLTGCATTVSLEPAPDANNPACADVTVRLPDTIDGEKRRWTDAQATGAWGDPSAVILACGVTPPGPTEARCITVGGVDWVIDESEAPRYRVTTYGRVPAVEVLVDNEVVSSNAVLDRLAPIVSAATTADSACISTSDAIIGNDG